MKAFLPIFLICFSCGTRSESDTGDSSHSASEAEPLLLTTTEPDNSCKAQRAEALGDFESGKFETGYSFFWNNPYYAEEIIYKRYGLRADIAKPQIGCIIFDDSTLAAEQNCYYSVIDSLIAVKFGSDFYSQIQKSADSLHTADPRRYGNECFYSPTYFPNEDSMFSDLRKVVRYPATAKRDSISGVVYVRLEIDSMGSITSATVAKGVRHDLDSAALEGALKLGRFRTELRWGIREAGQTTIPIRFVLE